MPFAQIIALLVSLSLFCLILNLTRKKKLKERNALFWLGICLCFLGLSVFLMRLGKLTNYLGIIDPGIFVLFLGFSLLFGITLLLSVQVSKIMDDLKTVIQKLALLNNEINELGEKAPEANKTEKD